ncbi:hypothetical protein [Sphingopyxis sp. USTB-05]|jgi:hypothetical protein|uniref:hypothetical protein n=2 Tax=unclassified Sphingopyxis TaxID=2614943 RepID=UPI0006C2CB1F|nr:hypothetical protein [Sphingopyxis sp. USTB-05]USI79212.1 hypothetical protein KEC45_10085 [Sphingopyxis sp. USTB-05]GAO78349.1 hypothetical protein SC1_01652 [Sphingopyxis sp. C-1]
MMSAATFAIVPAFLRFDVGAVGLEMGGAHGDYARLERCIVAPLLAISGQPITSSAGNLGALKGRLLVVDAEDGNVEWNGSIRRSAISNFASDAADYVVHIDLTTLAFDRLAQLMTIGRTLSGLSLDFQNIDGPLNDDPLDRPIPWDDVQYPHVALTNFTLRWT